MTKQVATEIKKAIKGYPVYFQSKTGKLRVRAYSYFNNYDKELERKIIDELLNVVSESGHKLEFEIEHRVYQGFIHTDIVFQ